jgi:hypothetical protein
MEELHIDSINGGHEGQLWARSRARKRAYSNKEAAVNKNDRLPDNGHTLLIYVKVSVRRSCLRNWTKYTMEMHRKKRIRRFYMHHFGINFTH